MKSFLLVSLLFVINYAEAFECSTKLHGETFTLNISEQRDLATLQFGEVETLDIQVVEKYDGTSNYSLITGEGIAVTYSNHFGCIKMVELISAVKLKTSPNNIGRLHFASCKGGQTPDAICK
jgi:hypothetical protein